MRTCALILSLGFACSVQARSDSFECSNDFDCGQNRICESSWCILGQRDSGVEPDAPVVDALVCPSECTTCTADECTIDCLATDECSDVVCPGGYDCIINCDGDGSCQNDVDCTNADDCVINCDGDGSCDGTVRCPVGNGDCRVDCGGTDACAQLVSGGTGDTDINCEGTNSCASGVDCAAACACDVDCIGVMCPMAATCPDGGGTDCTTTEGGCRTVGTCDTC